MTPASQLPEQGNDEQMDTEDQMQTAYTEEGAAQGMNLWQQAGTQGSNSDKTKLLQERWKRLKF